MVVGIEQVTDQVTDQVTQSGEQAAQELTGWETFLQSLKSFFLGTSMALPPFIYPSKYGASAIISIR